jgi:glutamate-ammonia-ligase adenylyltransferase
MKVSDHLSWIAETLLEAVLNLSWQNLVARHGRPSGPASAADGDKGFAIVAYGKLGGLELGYSSDLDLVFLHDAQLGDTAGPRPIDNHQFYARLGQRIIHLLTTHTRAGRLYETDMRLRPSGSSGPLVSQITSFEQYQRESAWTWENQAMVRARAVSGDQGLRERFEALRRQVLTRRRHRGQLRDDVRQMRERLRSEHLKSAPGRFDLKQGPGGMVDIEFLIQYLVLLKAHRYPQLVQWPDIVRILSELDYNGILNDKVACALRRAYLSYRAAAHRLSLQNRPAMVPASRLAQQRAFVRRVWQAVMDAP